MSEHSPYESSSLGPDITSLEAHMLTPRLLKRVLRNLTEQNIKNARTIESAGELVPCIYVEIIAAQQRSRSQRETLPSFGAVAEILNELGVDKVPSARTTRKKSSEPRLRSGGQLAQALRRFKRFHPKLYQQLRSKLSNLHALSKAKHDDWHQAYVRDIATPEFVGRRREL